MISSVKSFLNKLTREANFLSLAANLSIAFFGFAGFALLARSYPVELFGQWVLYISSAAFIEMFRFGITNTAIIRYLSGVDQNDRLKYVGSNGLIGLVATIGILIILWTIYLIFPTPIHNAGYAFMPGAQKAFQSATVFGRLDFFRISRRNGNNFISRPQATPCTELGPKVWSSRQYIGWPTIACVRPTASNVKTPSPRTRWSRRRAMQRSPSRS